MKATDQCSRLTVPRRVRKVHFVSMETLQQKRLAALAEQLLESPESDWLCVFCHSRVAHDRDRFEFEGKDEFTFINPDGIRFEIITFSHADSCHETGVPTLEHTWFPGHRWSYCQCGECGLLLGWYYKGQHRFAGLIRARLIKGLHIRN